MRLGAAALALVAVAACSGGDRPPAKPDTERVQEALAATRAAGTGTYVVTQATELVSGALIVRREGTYDAKASRASAVTTFSADPPERFGEMVGSDVSASDLTSHTVVDKSVVYLRMPGWPASINKKWLRFKAGDLPQGVSAADVESAAFPPMVDMLADAVATQRKGDSDTAYVRLASPLVFASYPSAGTTRRLVDAGLDPDSLTGSIVVEVTLTGGVVSGVSFDALPMFVEAYEQIGREAIAGQLRKVPTSIELSRHGTATKVAVPAARDVLSEAEFNRAF